MAYTLLITFVLLSLFTNCSNNSRENEPPDLSAFPWLYLRQGEPFQPDGDLVELIAVGDIVLGGQSTLSPDRLMAALTWLKAADITIGNLEGVILSTQTVPQPQATPSAQGPFPHLMLRSSAKTLSQLGFDILSLANNHALDRGETGLAETRQALKQVGIETIGGDQDATAPPQIIYRTIKGVRLAFLAFNTIPLPTSSEQLRQTWDLDWACSAIHEARAQVDLLIISVHWGNEYQITTDPAQVQMAQSLLEAGADLILGHHPHVIQGTQVFALNTTSSATREGFVAYSLGNFIFEQPFAETQQGLALRIFMDKNGLRGVQALPVGLNPQTHLLSAEEAKELVPRIQPPPLVLGFKCDMQACQPTTAPQKSRSGLFNSGAIDLTGDGIAERIERIAGSVRVYQGQELVWESPSEWQVLDLALGDPNDDGRYEMVIALRKPDAQGVMRSHPFVVGYRGGMYKLLWGGSAVSDPIFEVELADVDADGKDELIVLEEQKNGKTALTVWDWHGWGFSLLWRSAEGWYRDVTVEKTDGNIIHVNRYWAVIERSSE